MKKKVKAKKLPRSKEQKHSKEHATKKIKVPVQTKQHATIHDSEITPKKRSWFFRLIPIILLVAGYMLGSSAQSQQDPLLIGGLIVFILGFFLLPMLVQRKHFGWWMWGILFFIISIATIFYRGIKIDGGTIMVDYGFVIGGIFFLIASLVCLPITFRRINKKEKISQFMRTVIVLLCYICAVLFSFFTR